jgi:hypothetical protein
MPQEVTNQAGHLWQLGVAGAGKDRGGNSMKAATLDRDDAIADAGERPMSVGPVLKTVVVTVRDLGRSVEFYRHLLGLSEEVAEPEAAMLVSPAGTRMYLREIAKAVHATVNVGIQFGVWVMATQRELERAERYLKENNAWVSTGDVLGGTVIEGRDPDNLLILLVFPEFNELPKAIVERVYRY